MKTKLIAFLIGVLLGLGAFLSAPANASDLNYKVFGHASGYNNFTSWVAGAKYPGDYEEHDASGYDVDYYVHCTASAPAILPTNYYKASVTLQAFSPDYKHNTVPYWTNTHKAFHWGTITRYPSVVYDGTSLRIIVKGATGTPTGYCKVFASWNSRLWGTPKPVTPPPIHSPYVKVNQ